MLPGFKTYLGETIVPLRHCERVESHLIYFLDELVSLFQILLSSSAHTQFLHRLYLFIYFLVH